MKIKITEYFPGSKSIGGSDLASEDPRGSNPFASPPPSNGRQHPAPTNILGSNDGSTAMQQGDPGSNGARYYTIQRVNGNGANGKEGVPTGGHKHSIEDSDKVKKNSIYRFLLKEEKQKRKSQVSQFLIYSGYFRPLEASSSTMSFCMRSCVECLTSSLPFAHSTRMYNTSSSSSF